MATWGDVRALVAALPGTDEHASYGGRPAWRVNGKAFVFERPLRARDRADLAGAAPSVEDPILGVRVADEGIKQALVSDEPEVFFTIPHFDGYPTVLVRLDRIGPDELAELVTEAWRRRAPKRLVADFGDDPSTPRPPGPAAR